MKTTMTVLEAAAELESKLDKRKAKFDAAYARLADAYAADVEAIIGQYGKEAAELYDSLQQKKLKPENRKAAE